MSPIASLHAPAALTSMQHLIEGMLAAAERIVDASVNGIFSVVLDVEKTGG